MSALKRFRFLLYDSDDPETYQIPAEADVQRGGTLKKACLQKKNAFSTKKLQKKVFFWGFQGLHRNASNSFCMPLMTLKLTRHSPHHSRQVLQH